MMKSSFSFLSPSSPLYSALAAFESFISLEVAAGRKWAGPRGKIVGCFYQLATKSMNFKVMLHIGAREKLLGNEFNFGNKVLCFV